MSTTDSKEQDRLKVIPDLLEHGLTLTEIGQRVGLSGDRVSQIVRIHGLPRPVRADEPHLREKQIRILAFIRDFTARNSYPPTIREIASACNISSTSVVDYNLRQLEQRNFLTRKQGITRSIVLTERGRSQSPFPPDPPAQDKAA